MKDNNTPAKIDTEIKSSAKFTFDKEDILLIATEAKETELLAKRDTLMEALEEINLEKEQFISEARLELEKIFLSQIKGFENFTNVKVTSNVFSELVDTNAPAQAFYDINRLENVKNPKMYYKKTNYQRFQRQTIVKLGINEQYITLVSTVKFGNKNFDVTSHIPFYLKDTIFDKKVDTKIKKLLDTTTEIVNGYFKEIFRLSKEINLLELELLLLDTDKTIRSNLYKKILSQNPELKNLIEN